jgi:dihydroxyacetone synthase
MGALSHLPVVHIATHDSFGKHSLPTNELSSSPVPQYEVLMHTSITGEGQNGPTHQPVEVDSLFRATPNLTYVRPCNAEETIGAWMYVFSEAARTSPAMLSIARDPVGPVPNTDRFAVARGAYVLVEQANADITLVSCGSSLHHVVAAAGVLREGGLKCRIVSCPSFDLFDRQPREYRESVFMLDGKPIVSVEEYVATAWARYVTASVGMTTYGYSASNESNYERFGLDPKGIVRRVKAYLDFLDGRDARSAGWQSI